MRTRLADDLNVNLPNLRSLPNLTVMGLSPYFWIALADDKGVHGRYAMKRGATLLSSEGLAVIVYAAPREAPGDRRESTAIRQAHQR